MSCNQFPKNSGANESNIPVPKKINKGMKKSKRCAQLPELQKYIETIIKASNECETEDSTQSDKDKFPKDRRFGSYSVYKGLDSKSKQEKNKNQLNLTGSKNSIKAKTPNSESVSRGVRVYNTYAPEFEDPRNWKLGKTHSLGPNVEIEKFLKKFYPNPYHLENIKEFKTSKSDNTDELRDGTLPDVVISKANIHTEVDIENRNNDLLTADNEPCKREKKCLASDTDLETQSTPRHRNKIPDVKSVEGYSTVVPALSRKPSTAKSINSTGNVSSRASSTESITEPLSRELNLRKRKLIKSKPRSKPVKNDSLGDYDIGKLKLLSTSDSEQSLIKTGTEMAEANVQDVETTPELCEEIYRAEDFSDMKEIYNIMYKATESFLQMSSKNESKDLSKNFLESKISSRQLNKDTKLKSDTCEFNKNPELTVPSITNSATSNSCKAQGEIYTTEHKLDDGITAAVEMRFEEEEPKEKSLIDVLLKEDKFEYTCNPEDTEPGEVHNQTETVSNCNAALLEEVSRANTPEDKNEFTDTKQKNDEVLDFMYGCLKKFNNENPLQVDRKKSNPEYEKSNSCKKSRKESVTDINYERRSTSGPSNSVDFSWTSQDSTENLLEKTFPDIKDIKSKYSAALGEINRKASRTRCKKRPTLIGTGSLSNYPLPVSTVPTPGSPIPRSPCCQHLAEEINEIGVVMAIQTVESQNELGGFTEEPHEVVTVTDEIRTPKPLCPLSVKQKKSKTNTGKTLKDVLEAEEKLLSSEQKEVGEKRKDLTVCTTECQPEVQSETDKVYSHSGDFTRPSSNFVVCVNSFPRNLRNPMAIRPNLPVPESTSLSDLKNNWILSKLGSKFPLMKHSLSLEEGCYVLEHTYSIKQEVLLTMNKTAVAYTARPVSLKTTANVSIPVEEFSLKSSERLVTIAVIPMQQLVTEEGDTTTTTPELSTEEDDDKPVKDLIEALQDTEEKLYLLEQGSTENLHSTNPDTCSPGMSDYLKIELPENGVEKVNDRKKVHQLLLRTYNLQQKLHRYLQKMTCHQRMSASCPLMQHEGLIDFTLGKNTKIELDIKSETTLPLVHWHMKSPEVGVISRTDESVTVNVVMVDHSTSYEPPEEEKHEKVDQPKQEKTTESDERLLKDLGNDEDDRSSNCSFKSSNDFSEQNEAEPKNAFKDLDYMDNKTLFQKIYNEIESFRQSFEAEKLEKQQQQIEPSAKGSEDQMDRRLEQYDPKTPAKVLRTVFTGKKSSTELTIGLKDVPMTKVGNISVEKTKFSPNHTKISVAFTKETSGESNNLPPYLFNHMRSSLSTCITEYSGLKDDISKSSQSLNDASDGDEDDYKSVCSTLANSDEEEVEEEKHEVKDQKIVEKPTPKNFTKHRFDFYRKMTPDLDPTKSKPKPLSSPVCKYKELEPLKQALTDMQIRMRNIKREAIFSSNDYYERALKLAKMSAGFCQSCGNRAVIPNDTFGYYRTLLPRRSTHNRRSRHFRSTLTPNPSFYSLHSGHMDVRDQFCELGIKHSSYILNPRLHSNRTVLRSSVQDMPVLFGRF